MKRCYLQRFTGPHRKGSGRERSLGTGAAAVEFALVVPLLLVLVLGIAEFGRAYNMQTTLSGAAREGVREMALHNNPAARRGRHQGRGAAAGSDGWPDRGHPQHVRAQRPARRPQRPR